MGCRGTANFGGFFWLRLVCDQGLESRLARGRSAFLYEIVLRLNQSDCVMAASMTNGESIFSLKESD